MNLEPGWEKKALIILAVITIIVVIYAYGPFKGEAKVEYNNSTSEAPAPSPVPPVVTTNNSTSNNITVVNVTNGSNGTYQISGDQAKKIASQSGFTAGEPTKGTIMVNNNNISVWIVPLLKGTVVTKRIYVDSVTGVVVGSEEIKT